MKEGKHERAEAEKSEIDMAPIAAVYGDFRIRFQAPVRTLVLTRWWEAEETRQR